MAIPTDSQNIQSIFSSLTATQIAVVAGSIGAVVSAMVSAIFTLVNSWMLKRAENQRAMRELVMKYAVELHNQHVEIASKRGGGTLPVDAYVIWIAVLSDILFNERITVSNVETLLDRIEAISNRANKHTLKTRDYSKNPD